MTKEKDDRLDFISVDRLHTADHKALLEMKRKEEKLRDKLVTYRVNDTTLICATPERLKELIKIHTGK